MVGAEIYIFLVCKIETNSPVSQIIYTGWPSCTVPIFSANVSLFCPKLDIIILLVIGLSLTWCKLTLILKLMYKGLSRKLSHLSVCLLAPTKNVEVCGLRAHS